MFAHYPVATVGTTGNQQNIAIRALISLPALMCTVRAGKYDFLWHFCTSFDFHFFSPLFEPVSKHRSF
jgi:hypothetical protein